MESLSKIFKNKYLILKIFKHVREDVSGVKDDEEMFCLLKRRYYHWHSAFDMLNNKYIGLLIDKIKCGHPTMMMMDDIERFLDLCNDYDKFIIVYNKYQHLFISGQLLSLACKGGNLEIIRTLLNQKVPIILKRDGSLAGAAKGGHINILDYLMEKNVDQITQFKRIDNIIKDNKNAKKGKKRKNIESSSSEDESEDDDEEDKDDKDGNKVIIETLCAMESTKLLEWLFTKYGKDTIVKAAKKLDLSKNYNFNIESFRFLMEIGYKFNNDWYRYILKSNMKDEERAQVVAHMMIDQPSTQLQGWTVQSSDTYINRIQETVINQFPLIDKESPHFKQLVSNLIIIDSANIFDCYSRLEYINQSVSKIVESKLALSFEYGIDTQTIIDNILSNVPEPDFIKDRDSVDGATNLRVIISFIFKNSTHDKIKDLITLMMNGYDFKDTPIQEVVFRAVKSLLEREYDGQFAIEMVELTKSHFPTLSLFRPLLNNDSFSYERSFPTPKSKEAVIYLMDNLDHWNVTRMSNNNDIIDQFGTLIFDQLYLRNKIIDDNGSLTSEAFTIIQRATKDINNRLLEHILEYEGMIQVTTAIQTYSNSNQYYPDYTLQYATRLNKMFMIKAYLYNINIKSFDFIKWALSPEGKRCFNFKGSSDDFKYFDPYVIEQIIESGIMGDITSKYLFKTLLNSNTLDTRLARYLHKKLPSLWETVLAKEISNLIISWPIEIMELVTEIDVDIIHWLRESAQSIVPVAEFRHDLLYWLHQKGIPLSFDYQIKKYGDKTGMLTMINEAVKLKKNPPPPPKPSKKKKASAKPKSK